MHELEAGIGRDSEIGIAILLRVGWSADRIPLELLSSLKCVPGHFHMGEEAGAWLLLPTQFWHQGYKKSIDMPLLPLCDLMACSRVNFTCMCYRSAFFYIILCTLHCVSLHHQ